MSYTKQEFQSGDILFASQLNAMDDQIAKNEETGIELDGRVTNNDTLSKLHAEEIDGTTQTVVYDANGQISQILHKYTGTGTVVRTDAFTFGDTQIVETRTLAAGDTMTITTNLSTLQTTVETSIVQAA